MVRFLRESKFDLFDFRSVTIKMSLNSCFLVDQQDNSDTDGDVCVKSRSVAEFELADTLVSTDTVWGRAILLARHEYLPALYHCAFV